MGQKKKKCYKIKKVINLKSVTLTCFLVQYTLCITQSLTILACSETGSTSEIFSFLFLLICVPFTSVMWLGGFHCSELCSFKMRKVFVLVFLSPFLCTQGIFSYFVSQGVSPMSLLTCLSKLAFLWGQGRLPWIISRENLKVS